MRRGKGHATTIGLGHNREKQGKTVRPRKAAYITIREHKDLAGRAWHSDLHPTASKEGNRRKRLPQLRHR